MCYMPLGCKWIADFMAEELKTAINPKAEEDIVMDRPSQVLAS